MEAFTAELANEYPEQLKAYQSIVEPKSNHSEAPKPAEPVPK